MVYPLQEKLHISGMDGRAPSLARRWQLGCEDITFSYAPMLDDPAALPQAANRVAGLSRLWLHAPFAELIPCAIDPLVRQTAQHRFRQTLAAAQKLGIRQVVLHGGFIPHVYFPEWYVEQSVLFWRDFLQEVPPDFVLALENVMEPSPDTLVAIAAGVDDPGWGFVWTWGTPTPASAGRRRWTGSRPWRPYLRHVHLHNNRGQDDLHSPLDEGTVPMGEIIGAVLEQAPRTTFTIENQDALPPCAGWRGRGILRISYDRDRAEKLHRRHPPRRPGRHGRCPAATGAAGQAAGQSGRAGGYVRPSGGRHRAGMPANGQMPGGGIRRRQRRGGRGRVLRAPFRDRAAGHQHDPPQNRHVRHGRRLRRRCGGGGRGHGLRHHPGGHSGPPRAPEHRRHRHRGRHDPSAGAGSHSRLHGAGGAGQSRRRHRPWHRGRWASATPAPPRRCWLCSPVRRSRLSPGAAAA